MIDAGTHGAPNWADLSTPDLATARRFYGDLFGWDFRPHEVPMAEGLHYWIASSGGHDVGGLMRAPAGPAEGHPMWTVFFNVPSADDTARAAVEARGVMLQAPFDIPGARIAVVADPAGAMLALTSGPRPSGAWLSREPGRVCWVELLTRDPAAAEAFYTTVFGWKADTKDYDGTRYTRFLLDGDVVCGSMRMPDQVPAGAPSFWSVYFAVGDCEATAHRAVALGGRILTPAMDVGEGRFAVLEDSTGATFQIMEYAP